MNNSRHTFLIASVVILLAVIVSLLVASSMEGDADASFVRPVLQAETTSTTTAPYEPVGRPRETTTTTAPPKPKAKRLTASGSVWDRLAQCESGGNWTIDAFHDGGLQFAVQTWASYAPADFPPYAHQATREQQIFVAERVLRDQGWGAWPSCARKLGLL